MIRVTWWLTLKELGERNIAPPPPPLPFSSHSNLLKCRITEIIEDCCTTSTIHVLDIRDVAFVFHAKTFENEFVNCAGMSRVFYTPIIFSMVDCQN